MPGALPLFAAVIAWASGTERVSRRQLGGMLVIALGVALLLGESILAATPRQCWATPASSAARWPGPPTPC